MQAMLLFSQVQYLKQNRFGGAFVWSLDLDDFKGEFCGEGNYTLISHLRSLLASGNCLYWQCLIILTNFCSMSYKACKQKQNQHSSLQAIRGCLAVIFAVRLLGFCLLIYNT